MIKARQRPDVLFVQEPHVSQFGLLPALIAADLYFWLVRLEKPERWVEQAYWGELFAVSCDTVARSIGKLRPIINKARTRRCLHGRLVAGANKYTLNPKGDSFMAGGSSKKLNNLDPPDPQVFPISFIGVAKQLNAGVRVPELAWFLCRLAWRVHINERKTGESGWGYFQSAAELARYCGVGSDSLRKFSAIAKNAGLVLVNVERKSIVIPPGPPERLLLAPFRSLEEKRKNGLNAVLEDPDCFWQYDYVEDQLDQLKRG
ncbi:hypothetical protein ACFO3I_11970 [Rheinheimera marina]|uniref:Replication protein n=1 Tax=Rheinheimera marina TaxID=1774958 RepID=A0ABV9JN81_9GAMM